MTEVNGSIDALLNSPEMFFEIANDLSASLSKSLAEDDTQLAFVVKTLFDMVHSFTFTYISFSKWVLKSHRIRNKTIFKHLH